MRLSERLSRVPCAFLAPVEPRALGLFRLLYCGLLLWAIERDQGYRDALAVIAQGGENFAPIRLFSALGLGLPGAEAFAALRWTLLVSLGLAAAGVLARPALAVSLVSFLLYFGVIHGAGKGPLGDAVGHRADSVPWMLLILLAAPGVGRWSLRSWLRPRPEDAEAVPAWPLESVKLMLALIYFGAAWGKWQASPLWADGWTMQALLLEKAMLGQEGPGLWLAQHRGLCALLSAAGLAFESSFFLIFLYPRLSLPYAFLGLGLHAAIAATMGMNYLLYLGFAYVVFLCRPWSEPAPGGRPALPPRARALAGAFVAALLAVNLSAIVSRAYFWPISSWRFKPARYRYDQTSVHRLRLVYADGSRRWVEGRYTGGLAMNFKLAEALGAGDEAWVERTARFVAARLGAREREGLEAIALVRRDARRAADGSFAFEDRELRRFPAAR